MICEFAETHPGVECLCSQCHLSSTLFPRRRDGKIVLPTVASTEEIIPTYLPSNDISYQNRPHESIVERERFPPRAPPHTLAHQEQFPPNPNVPIQFLTSITSEPAHSFRHSALEEPCLPPRVGKQARSGIEKDSRKASKGKDEYTPGNRTTSSLANTEMSTCTMSVNPYPQPDEIDPPMRNSCPYPEAKASGSARRTNSKSTRASASPVDTAKGTTTIRFCPPFVETDRVTIPANSDKVNGIAWSASCRRQQYISDDDDFRHHFF